MSDKAAIALWTRLYMEIPSEDGCSPERDPESFPLLRARHLEMLVEQERRAARDEVLACAIDWAASGNTLEKWVEHARYRHAPGGERVGGAAPSPCSD